jgi:NhaA family Na+:H+ antiporter
MTVFFLAVGREIRREIHDGTLSSVRTAALPIAAAVGGIVAPATIFLLFNSNPDVRVPSG